MANLLEKRLLTYPRPYLTDAELAALLDGTQDSRYSKVKRMLAQNKLLHIRRGLYCITDEIGYGKKPNSFELAQYIYGPSYISLESALSFHGLIPEAVFTTTSVSNKRSKEFETPLGLFSFQQVHFLDLYTAVDLIKENGYQFFMAKPWKAICDYVFCYRKDWKGIDPLLSSLRIELENLPFLNNDEVYLLDEYYHSQRMKRFLKGVQIDLNNLQVSSSLKKK